MIHVGADGMDTKTAMVGQHVYVYPGYSAYGYWKGKVVKVTSAGVEVQLLDPWPGESLIRFGNDGTELEVRRNLNVAPEQQPWILDAMPFAERTALIEQASDLLNTQDAGSKDSER